MSRHFLGVSSLSDRTDRRSWCLHEWYTSAPWPNSQLGAEHWTEPLRDWIVEILTTRGYKRYYWSKKSFTSWHLLWITHQRSKYSKSFVWRVVFRLQASLTIIATRLIFRSGWMEAIVDGASCEHVNKKSDVVWITKGMKVRTFVRIGEVSNNIFLTKCHDSVICFHEISSAGEAARICAAVGDWTSPTETGGLQCGFVLAETFYTDLKV